MRNFVFVTGLRKSGTTLVKSLLDGHPRLFMFPTAEFELFHYSHHPAFLAEKHCRERDFNTIKNAFVRNRFIERLNKPEIDGDLRTTINLKHFQAKVEARHVSSYTEIIKLFFEAMAESSSYFHGSLEEMMWGCKCVLNEEYVPEILRWYPDARIIYVLRNPYGHFNAIRHSLRSGVKREGQQLRWWRNAYPPLGAEVRKMRLSYLFMEKWEEIYPKNFYVLVYDRLLEDPERELRALCDFVGIEFSQTMLSPTSGGEKWGGNSWKVKEFDAIDKRPASHWMEDISALEVRLINEYFDDVLAKYRFPKLHSSASLLRLNHISERPLTYILNRLLFKAPSWFGGARSYKHPY